MVFELAFFSVLSAVVLAGTVNNSLQARSAGKWVTPRYPTRLRVVLVFDENATLSSFINDWEIHRSVYLCHLRHLLK